MKKRSNGISGRRKIDMVCTRRMDTQESIPKTYSSMDTSRKATRKIDENWMQKNTEDNEQEKLVE